MLAHAIKMKARVCLWTLLTSVSACGLGVFLVQVTLRQFLMAVWREYVCSRVGSIGCWRVCAQVCSDFEQGQVQVVVLKQNEARSMLL